MPANTPDAPATGSWIAPLFSTLLTLPLGLFALVFAMFSPMACDNCDGAEADRFDAAFEVAFPTLLVGLLVSLGLLIAAWIPPRRAGLAVAAPLTVVVTLLVFMGVLGTR
ncbi:MULTISPECIES: hypothetical protein [Streptomyces]|uniref:Uncharacterized protein (DUF983 family) n=1 Tax=Streptomyces nymphaeiformis TaxID=2663842 RepID=A0A7W7X9Q1_9ACTN|nr:hypothetical protein [Streptomyces nymphaeiformis]MBB4979636.1 uncharacterized protein (DUF983 family) [Streptomyces nymphaeiformis]